MLWNEVQILIRTFRWRDLPRLYRLRARGVYLDLERYVTAGYPLFRLALRSWWTADARTYVAYSPITRAWYMLQAARREDRPEWDVTFLSPATATTPADMEQWQRLLRRAVRDALHRGVYRLYAALPETAPFHALFQSAGFRPYCREHIYRQTTPAEPRVPLVGEVRPYRPEDAWEFRRFWRQVTPQVVAAAEGLTAQNGLAIPHTWTPRADNRVYLWMLDGHLRGAVAVRSGPHGRWLRFLPDPDVGQALESLVMWGVRLARQESRTPLYVAVPEYVGGVAPVLLAQGFVGLMERSLMVRHLAVPLQADATVPQGVLSWLEIGGEPAFLRPLHQGSTLLTLSLQQGEETGRTDTGVHS